jgi:IAA-amino acid hydrolase
VKLFFQPAGGGHAGAYHMIKEVVLDGVQAIFALHVSPFNPTGTVGLKAGPVMAASGRFHAMGL